MTSSPPVERERRAAGEQVRERPCGPALETVRERGPVGEAREPLDEVGEGRRLPVERRRIGADARIVVGRAQGPVEGRTLVAGEATGHRGGEPREGSDLGRERTIGRGTGERERVEAHAGCAEIEVRPAELVGQPAVVAQRIHREHPDPADETAAHLGAREHRLAGPGLAQHDRVVARVGEPVEHDRRPARLGPPVQVPRGLVQVRGGVEEGGGERCRSQGCARRAAVGAGPGRAARQASASRNVATSSSSPVPRPSSLVDSIRSVRLARSSASRSRTVSTR